MNSKKQCVCCKEYKRNDQVKKSNIGVICLKCLQNPRASIEKKTNKKRTKYNSKTCTCLSGHSHDSRGEATYCDILLSRKQDKQIKDYKTQHAIRCYVNGKLICTHYVDFLVTTNEGKEEFHEYKGFATDTWRMKRKIVEALYQDIPYIVIKHK